MTVTVRLREVMRRREETGSIVKTEVREGTMKTVTDDVTMTTTTGNIVMSETIATGVVMTTMMPGLIIEMTAPGVIIEISNVMKTTLMAEIASAGITIRNRVGHQGTTPRHVVTFLAFCAISVPFLSSSIILSREKTVFCYLL